MIRANAPRELPVVTAHVDGSSRGNPGPGGWAVVLETHTPKGPVRKELSGGVERTTNNTMELFAVLKAVGAIKVPAVLRVVTDSQTVIGWLTGRTAVNQALHKGVLTEIRRILSERDITLFVEHTRGHAGDPGNERANALAQASSARVLRELTGGTA